MHHVKLILFGVVLVVGIVFGFIFWGDLSFNQQELSNTPLEVPVEIPAESAPASDSAADPGLSQSDEYDDLDRDLDQTSLEIDSDLAEMESELEGL